MHKISPKFSYVSDSEDSDSSSSTEKEKKKTCVVGQVLTEIIKPSTIEICENDLASLIKRIEATLSFTKKPLITKEVREKIQQFLMTINEETIFFFLQNDELNVTNAIYPDSSTSTMYFTKISSGETSNDFFKLLIFGNIEKEINESLILALKMVFIYIIYNMRALPYRIKRRITKNMEEFLLYLTEKHFRCYGISEVYIPALSFFEYSEIHRYAWTNDIIELMEVVIVSCCQTISDAVYDDEIDFQSIKDFNTRTLFQIWQYKCDNLQLIFKYLSDEHSKKVYQILKEHNSVHLRLLSELQIDLQKKIIESKSILSYLKIFKQAFEKLETEQIGNIPQLLPDLFQVVHNITSSSSYFKRWENLNYFLISISRQIINVCQKKVKVEAVLKGDTEQCMKNVIKSVETCYLYKEILKNGFFEIVLGKQYSQGVVNPIEAYMKRCQDFLNLCSLINIFSCSQNNGRSVHITIEQHIKVEGTLKTIHNNFSSSLNQFNRIQDKLLYIQCTNWCSANEQFQNELHKIEEEILNFAQTSFGYVTTIEDELNVIRILYHYSKLHSLKSFFLAQNDRLINKVLEEIITTKEYLFSQNVTSLIMDLSTLDLAMSIFLKKRRIQFLYKLINDCNWLMKDGLFEKMKIFFNECIVAESQSIFKNYKQWLENIDQTNLNKLKRPLIGKCFYKSGLLEVNIDRKMLKVIKESRAWVQIGFKLPANLDKISTTLTQVLILHGNVEDLVINYNKIISGLTVGEHALFSEVINSCFDIISFTMYTMLWDYDESNHIILDYLKHVKYVEHILSNYKHSNKRIIETCKLICCINFLHISKTEMINIKAEICRNRLVCLKKIINHYNTITSCMQTIFDSFGYHVHKMKEIWNVYLEKVDKLLEFALQSCLTNSINILLNNFSSTPTLDNDNPINIEISAIIDNGKINFSPNLNEILTFFSLVDEIILEAFQIIPRLFNKFKMAKAKKKISYAKQLAKNEKVANIQNQINKVLLENLKFVKLHLNFWNQYRFLWKTDIEKYSKQYISNSSASSYSADFFMYLSIIKDISNTSHIHKISLFSINTEKLAKEVITQCHSRLKNLSIVLKTEVIHLLDDFQTYVDCNRLRLNELVSKEQYLSRVKDLIAESYQKETEIQNIQNYIHVLRQFKFHDDLLARQEMLHKSWCQYKHILERNKLKAKIMYNTIV